MPLRLIEMVLPESKKEDLEDMLKEEDIPILGIWIQPVLGVWEHPVGGVWERSFTEPQILVKMLISTDESESVLDTLESRFSKDARCRLVLLPVQASLPRMGLVKEKETKIKTKSSPPESKQKTKRERISREELYADVAYTTRLSKVYFFMVFLSSIVAAIGVLRDNVAVIIGAMVIAPLLGPNVSLSLATTMGDVCLARNALKANLVGMLTAIAVSFVLGFVLVVNPEAQEVVSRTSVGLGDVALALAAGSAGALAFTTGVSATLIGVMVAVALLPPLVTFGLLMGSGNESLAVGAILLFITNLICVNLAGVVTFLAQGIGPARWKDTKKARNATLAAMLLWALMLALLVIVIRHVWQ